MYTDGALDYSSNRCRNTKVLPSTRLRSSRLDASKACRTAYCGANIVEFRSATCMYVPIGRISSASIKPTTVCQPRLLNCFEKQIAPLASVWTYYVQHLLLSRGAKPTSTNYCNRKARTRTPKLVKSTRLVAAVATLYTEERTPMISTPHRRHCFPPWPS